MSREISLWSCVWKYIRTIRNDDIERERKDACICIIVVSLRGSCGHLQDHSKGFPSDISNLSTNETNLYHLLVLKRIRKLKSIMNTQNFFTYNVSVCVDYYYKNLDNFDKLLGFK